ncbi:MAG TPA: PAS domain-containing protein [Spirochaetota bacterium]|nr:PAS domain-containing protein [Spirochaetota bacterium]
MIEIFDKIQCDVKNMILFSQRPMFIFNENRNIVFCNSAFIKKFNFSEKDAPVGKIPDFLYTMISDQETLFSEIPIDFLIEDDILFQIDKNYLNEENLLFKLILDKIKTTDNSILYLSSLIEITEIKESLVEKSINALLKASQLKDNDTGNHIQRIN